MSWLNNVAMSDVSTYVIPGRHLLRSGGIQKYCTGYLIQLKAGLRERHERAHFIRDDGYFAVSHLNHIACTCSNNTNAQKGDEANYKDTTAKR